MNIESVTKNMKTIAVVGMITTAVVAVTAVVLLHKKGKKTEKPCDLFDDFEEDFEEDTEGATENDSTPSVDNAAETHAEA